MSKEHEISWFDLTRSSVLRLNDLQVEMHIHKPPDIAINSCTGRFIDGILPADHKTFVIMKSRSRRKEGENIWEDGVIAEYDSLDEALSHPGAKPWGTGTLCTACRSIRVEDTFPKGLDD